MGFKERYEKSKKVLLENSSICKENREVFTDFFNYQERKLKRINNLTSLDERSYKTLTNYVYRLRNMNSWFGNKPFKKLNENDLMKVYEDLEEGRIISSKGKPFKDLDAYYNDLWKSYFFDMCGLKDKAIKIINEFPRRQEPSEVRFIKEETFRQLVTVAMKPEHKALFWMAWDIGENISTLLDLQKKDFTRQINEQIKEAEYVVNLPREKLKRSRTPRSEVTNYKETTEMLDIILKDLKEEDRPFGFGERAANQALDRAVRIVKAKCIPNGEKVSWKDLRSSMACDLISKHWTTDEIKRRLGHTPSSRVLDRYVNYLATNRHEAKKKIFDSSMHKLQTELEETKQNEKLQAYRLKQQGEQLEQIKKVLEQVIPKEKLKELQSVS